MNPDNIVEYNSLSWVKAQLDDVLLQAQADLNEFIESKDSENLANCLEHLQLIFGTLQMVEVYGAAMLADEIQKTIAALLAGDVESEENTFDVLMRAMLHLPDYLEKIQSGQKDVPITLMPLFNDLRAARNEGLLSESVLFSPELSDVSLASAGYDAASIEPGKLQDEVKRLRAHYQLGLLDFIQNKKVRVGLQRIKAVMRSLEKVSSEGEIRRIWIVTGALIDGLLTGGIETNLTIKNLLATVDRQLKIILDVGEDEYLNQYSKELVKNILYYIGMCTVDSKAVSVVKEAYHLDDQMPHDPDDSDELVGGLNADLFDTVSVGITEDLNRVKDVLELFMTSNDRDLEQLEPVAEQIGKIADTYGMLGMGAVRQSIMEQKDVMERIISRETEFGEAVVLNIASELLNAESALKDYIAERSGFVDLNRKSEGQVVPASEYRAVVLTVVSEALANFSVAKEAILSYVSGVGDKEQLDIMLERIEEVRGVALILPMARVESLIVRLMDYIRIALLNNNHKPDDVEQDVVADVVTSIEYFFEALSEGRPGVEQGLSSGNEAAKKLEVITQSYADAAGSGSEEPEIEEPEIEELDSAADVDAQSKKKDDSSITEKTVVASGPDNIDTFGYIILADDADEEIVEIFIEEAVEVLGELHTYLPQWRDAGDEEALAVIRRNFHTLKGSGRLLGAELIGEFSWKFENLLNHVVDSKIDTSAALFGLLDEAVNVVPQLIEQLKGNREPIENISLLMESADAMAEKREINLNAVKDTAAVEVVVDELAESDDIIVIDVAASCDDVAIDILDLGVDVDVNDADEEIKEGAETNDLEVDSDNEIADLAGFTDEESEEIIDVSTVEGEALIDIEDIGNSAEDPDVIDILELDVEVASDDDIDLEADIEAIDPESVDLVSDETATFAEDIIVLPGRESVTEGAVEPVDSSTKMLDVDPILLKVYIDESKAHVEVIRQQISESDNQNRPLNADQSLRRSFHTLYGSARTAEVEAVAELCGPAEKYIKARQDAEEENIPEDVAAVIREIVDAVSQMIELVVEKRTPDRNKELQDKINKIVQQEIQAQLQKSWQENAEAPDSPEVVTEEDGSVNDELAAETDDVEIVVTEPVADVEFELKIVSDTGAIADVPDDHDVAEETVVMSYSGIDDELIDIFLEEADELLESCDVTLAEIQKTPDSKDHINQLQRNMHTLKGGARMAELVPIGDLTHNLESLVGMVDEKKVEADKSFFDLLQEALDSLVTMLDNVKQRQDMISGSELSNRIEMLMRGEVAEKRAVERYDLELSDIESSGEAIEDISNLMPAADIESDVVTDAASQAASQTEAEAKPVEQEPQLEFGRRKDDREKDDSEKDEPHWGERTSDINYRDSQEQVRVRSDLLNNLVDYAGEVNIYHARMGEQVSDFGFNLSELSQTVVRLKEQLRNLEIETEIQIRSGYEKESDSFDANFDPLEMDQYSTMQQLTRSLSETAADVDSINDILQGITRDSETLLVQESRVSSELQEGLMRTRMVRFGGLSSRLRRIVRQISRELGKEVKVEISGESSEIDRTVLDRIISPLEHMIRNAVAHGIEKPEVRKAAGKSEAGNILIEVDRQGTDVLIDVIDDGAGIDAGKVREKATKQGFMSADQKLSDNDVLQFIMRSGLSTADEVTQVAGRGVGMDVVDSEIKQLGGVLSIDSTRGKGTKFHIRLPLTLAINQALLVDVSDDVFAVPIDSVEGVVRITGLELQQFYDSGNNHYEFNGVDYVLKHMGGMLTGRQSDYSKQLRLFPVLLVHVGDQHFALHVDELIGRREIVVKPVGMQIGTVRGIAGATILADGRVVLILEMSALIAAESLFKQYDAIEEVAQEVIQEVVAVDDKKTIMVVDDSITIRKVTERMLLRHGIEVILAKDGIDATNILQESAPDLMLLDIEMPRMDGFEVAGFVRNDDRLKDLPIIMITSRTGSKHKEKAAEIGVNRYLGKPFQEDDLLANINEILKTAY